VVHSGRGAQAETDGRGHQLVAGAPFSLLLAPTRATPRTDIAQTPSRAAVEAPHLASRLNYGPNDSQSSLANVHTPQSQSAPTPVVYMLLTCGKRRAWGLQRRADRKIRQLTAKRDGARPPRVKWQQAKERPLPKTPKSIRKGGGDPSEPKTDATTLTLLACPERTSSDGGTLRLFKTPSRRTPLSVSACHETQSRV